MSGEKPQQSSTGLTQEEIEVPTIVKSVCLPPRLKFHFFQISKDAVCPSELYRPDSVLYNPHERKIYRSWDFLERIYNVSEFVKKMFATMHCVLVPSATARDFKYPGEYGTLNITNNVDSPHWLDKAANTENQTAIDIDPLLDGFSKILGQVDKQNSFFNFSLVSSNHAHNLPVAFAFYAFNNAMKYQLKEEAGEYKRIVINFDYHIDTGISPPPIKKSVSPPPIKKSVSPLADSEETAPTDDQSEETTPTDDQSEETTPMPPPPPPPSFAAARPHIWTRTYKSLGQKVKSLGWGMALFYNQLSKRAEFAYIADLYISIGIGGDQESRAHTIALNDKSTTPANARAEDEVKLTALNNSFSIEDLKNFGAVWDYIKTKAGVNETNKALVYVTWDRDVGSDGFTDWPLQNKPLDRGDVNTSICNCVKLIKQDDGLVVGFDVTGMPDNLKELRENCVQRNIMEKNNDVLAAFASPDSNLDTRNAADKARIRVGGYFIVHKDDKDAFLGKAAMTNHISAKARNYYFTMMKDISRVLLTLKDCDYLVHC